MLKDSYLWNYDDNWEYQDDIVIIVEYQLIRRKFKEDDSNLDSLTKMVNFVYVLEKVDNFSQNGKMYICIGNSPSE